MSAEDVIVEDEENLDLVEGEEDLVPVEDDLDNQPQADDHEKDEPEESLPSLKADLKKSRWNVFLFLGVAFVMFGFALFPMTINIDYDGLWGTSEKDIGFVWGPSVAGEDFMDVPFEIEVKVVNAPTSSENITLVAYVLKTDDCQDFEVSELESIAREGGNHDYQFASFKSPLEGETYTFDFNLDMGQHCAKVLFVDDSGKIMKENALMETKGKLWPNQILAGIPGLILLGLSIFAFIGAQKKGAKVKAILENQKVSEEQLVLEAAAAEKIAQGPAGPPKSSGPAGPPQTTGPSGPPQPAKRSGPPPSSTSSAPADSKRSGPPPSEQIQAVPEIVEQELVTDAVEPNLTAETGPQIEQESTFEPAGNGYFYRKMADGSYEQIVYVQSEDGNYIPYQQ